MTQTFLVADRLDKAVGGCVPNLCGRSIINIKPSDIPVIIRRRHRKPSTYLDSPALCCPTYLPTDMSPPATKNDSGSEKPDVVHQDDALFRTVSEAGPEKPVPRIGKVDYSGAYEKTDPKEIALVKKLDKWIMPMLWCEYHVHPTSSAEIRAGSLRLPQQCTGLIILIGMPSLWLV